MPWRSLSSSMDSTGQLEQNLRLSSENHNRVGTSLGTGSLTAVAGTLLPAPVTASAIAKRDRAGSVGSRNTTRNGKKPLRFAVGFREHWAQFVRRMGAGTAPSTSSVIDASTGDSSIQLNRILKKPDDDPDDAEVDEIVVDRTWSEDLKSSTVPSDHGGSPEKSGAASHQPGGSTDRESVAVQAQGIWATSMILIIIRYRIWPTIVEFFYPSFMDTKSEDHYRRELWFYRKGLAFWCSMFLVLNWVLGTSFVPRPFLYPDNYFYYLFGPLFTVPLPLMIMYNINLRYPAFYQFYLGITMWMWTLYQVVLIYLCGQYNPKHAIYPTCGNKDFVLSMFFTSSLPTIALFGLQANRLTVAVGTTVFVALSAVLIVPDRHTWARSIITICIYQAFLLYLHYMNELADRRLHSLREQLKVQFRATQKAQVNERKASDSKRRLTSYVFHEVRVPLNTALLAVQNMEADGAIPKAQEIEFKALTGSLSMMSKVLNDVLDFNRMDSGRFESVSKPYAFHQVMKSMFVPLRLATNARQLEFITELDDNIDKVSRRAAYEALGLSPADVEARLADTTNEDADGFVVGDETRLRQIVTNLASNACKFTPAGGKLHIRTRLVLPYIPPGDSTNGVIPGAPPLVVGPTTPGATPAIADGEMGVLSTPAPAHHHLSATHLERHNLGLDERPRALEWIVIRIEVHDTGPGIRPKDMVQSKLFSAFNQTEAGRQQGGKGTGLGLALVRQIVKLSGGRLGLQSKTGENSGSSFWFELPVAVGMKAVSGLSPIEQERLKAPGKVFRPPPPMRMPSSPTVSHATASTRNSRASALHGIMDQGGLVELVPDHRRQASTSIVTRTLGDPSTGTDAGAGTLQGVTHSPIRPPFVEHSSSETTAVDSGSPFATSRTSTEKPTFVALPSPPQFTSLNSQTSLVSSSVNTDEATPRARSTAAPSPPASVTHTFEKGLNVLVVDDDPLTRTLMKRMLTRLGCIVATAENGELALELITAGAPRPTPSSEGVPDSVATSSLAHASSEAGSLLSRAESRFAVVFLDNQMPVMSGLEAVSRLRDLGRSDFVVGVTGNALLSDQEEYLAAGVDQVLTKPVLERSLRGVLAVADERRKNNGQIIAQASDASPRPKVTIST